MDSPPNIPSAASFQAAPPWRTGLMAAAVIGGLGALLGAFNQPRQFGHSYLLAFMFFLSLALGSLFLVMLHHLFDSSWSVPIRRFVEHLAYSLPVMAALFIPLALLAPTIYPWMSMDPQADHALHAKSAFLNKPFFYLRAIAYFAIWSLLSHKLRYWSIRQDQNGAAECTFKMRKYSAGGIFLFAVTLTFASIDWMKSLTHEWFSTMYGVYYFSGSVWMTIATVYMISVLLTRAGYLREVLHLRQFHDLGVLLLAFTVFSAYIHFSQYLIIWNANLPEETFWYLLREKGSWWQISLLLVFGHFLAPFLALLRIDAKITPALMIPLCLWVWIMHFVDMSFNVMPSLHPDGFVLHWLDLACLAFIGGVLGLLFLKRLAAHPIFPIKDPRLKECLVYRPVPPPAISEAVEENGFNL